MFVVVKIVKHSKGYMHVVSKRNQSFSIILVYKTFATLAY
jgi:hypothetical protein